MENNKYKIRYLPIFYDDLKEKALYISETLQNPDAASKLLDEVERAIVERLPIAESFEPYISSKKRLYPYYRIYVENFIVFYVVIDDGNGVKYMEVRRFLYKRQNNKPLL